MLNKKGFTLIEIVVVAAILAVMLSGVYVIFDQGARMFAKDRSQVANQETIRTTMNSIEKKIRKANHPNQPLFVNGANCLIIKSVSTTDTFCRLNDAITLNGNILLDRVAEFTPTVINSNLTVTITSIADSMGQANSVTNTYHARKGGTSP